MQNALVASILIIVIIQHLQDKHVLDSEEK